MQIKKKMTDHKDIIKTTELKGTSAFSNSMIWFGCAVSIAEILTGTQLASLGMLRGSIAILSGHLAGCILLILQGLIGGTERKNSMESVGISFGKSGSRFFAVLNVAQLIGWQGILIYDGAVSANGIYANGRWIWCLVIGVLTVIWVMLSLKILNILNIIAMSALLILTIMLCKVIFFDGAKFVDVINKIATVQKNENSKITFGQGFELSIAMSLSWLPMISDYTSKAAKPRCTAIASSVTYSLAGSWMYLIGLGAACFTHEVRIDKIMTAAGLGVAGLMIIVLSCVTTNFIDAYSFGESVFAIFNGTDKKMAGVIDTIIGTALALIFPMDDISGFLYLIGSFFAPMIAVHIADYYILKKDRSFEKVSIHSFIVWVIGFIIYRILMKIDTPVGSTIPDMVITGAIAILTGKIIDKIKRSSIT